jgi:hypothetical protein
VWNEDGLESGLPCLGDDLALFFIHHFFGQMPILQKVIVNVFHPIVDLYGLFGTDVHAVHTFDTSQRVRQACIGVKGLGGAFDLTTAAHATFLDKADRMAPPSLGAFLSALQQLHRAVVRKGFLEHEHPGRIRGKSFQGQGGEFPGHGKIPLVGAVGQSSPAGDIEGVSSQEFRRELHPEARFFEQQPGVKMSIARGPAAVSKERGDFFAFAIERRQPATR